MMSIDSIFSLKDYFSYYLTGFVWIIDILLLMALFEFEGVILEPVVLVGNYLQAIGSIPSAVLLLLVPQITGYILFPLSRRVRLLWQGADRKRRPDPRQWVVGRSEDVKRFSEQPDHIPFLKSSRLSKKESRLVVDLVENKFGLKYKPHDVSLFYLARVYLLENSQEAAAHSVRLRDLMYLSESLLVSVPVFFGLLTGVLLGNAWGWLGVPLGILFQQNFINGYHRLEIQWVKRVFRGFIIVANKN